MSRADISGFTLAAFGYSIEVVTYRRMPCVVALWRGSRLCFRKEF